MAQPCAHAPERPIDGIADVRGIEHVIRERAEDATLEFVLPHEELGRADGLAARAAPRASVEVARDADEGAGKARRARLRSPRAPRSPAREPRGESIPPRAGRSSAACRS